MALLREKANGGKEVLRLWALFLAEGGEDQEGKKEEVGIECEEKGSGGTVQMLPGEKERERDRGGEFQDFVE